MRVFFPNMKEIQKNRSSGKMGNYTNNFTLRLALFLYHKCRTRIMETYWCTQKNSIIDIMNGKKIPLALSSCIKSDCDRWRDGECIHINRIPSRRR